MQIVPLSLLISLFFVCFAAANSGANIASAAFEAALLKWETQSAVIALAPSPPIASRTAKRETNADRFRRGLGPLPPARIKARSARAYYYSWCNTNSSLELKLFISETQRQSYSLHPVDEVSRILVFLPSTCISHFFSSPVGTIQVKRVSDGVSLGYISKFYDSQASFTITTNPTAAIQVSLPSISPFGTPIDITVLNGQDPNHVLIGAVGGSAGYHFASGQVG